MEINDLEKTKRALEYIERLADGIDPVTGEIFLEDSVYNNARLCRCFYFVADILRQVIANGGNVGGKTRKPQFVFDAEQMKNIKPSEDSLAISKFTEYIHTALGGNSGKIPYKPIVDWLFEKGYLEEKQTEKGSKKIASEAGVALGLKNAVVQGAYGSYTAVYYNTRAQQFILDNLAEIFK